MFKLYFNEVNPNTHWDDIHDFKGIEFNPDGTMKIPEPKTEEKVEEKVEEKPVEKAEEKPVEKTEEPKVEDEVDEESDSEDAESDTEEPAEESSEEDSEEDTEEVEEEDTPILEKRLKDTQRAFHEGQQKIKSLEERLAKLEKPVEQKPDELTLMNIDPKVLAASMTKDPVMTTRWIVDQQTKISMTQREEERQKLEAEATKAKRIETSETEALKRFPVLDQILKMDKGAIDTFKTEHPEQFEFAQKTVQYQKQFEQRGDDEALYNAAARAYAELSPKALEKIKEDIKKAVTKAQTDKQKAAKQAAVSTGTGTKHSKQVKRPSEGEFFKLNPQEQQDAMYADFQRRLANLNKK